MNVIPMTQCRKCTDFTKERKCRLRPDLLTSLSPGRKRRCTLSDRWLTKLAENFVHYKTKTAAFSIRQLTGSSIKLKSTASKSKQSLFSKIWKFIRKILYVHI
jgi:hypothetical protein